MSVSDLTSVDHEDNNAAIQKWHRPFQDLIRSDLQSASSWYTNENILILQADLSVIDHENILQYKTAFVLYCLRTLGDRTWLIRNVYHFDQDTIYPHASELITAGIVRFELTQTPPPDLSLDLAPDPDPNAAAEPNLNYTENSIQIPIADPLFDLERLARAMTPTPSSVDLMFFDQTKSSWTKSLILH